MEILSEKDLTAVFDLEDLFELISVPPSFENHAKALLGKRTAVLSPEPIKESSSPKPTQREPAPQQALPVPQPKEVSKKLPEVIPEKKTEPPPFSTITLTLSERGFSHLHFLKEIPEDKAARIIKQHYLWKYPDVKVLLLTFTQDEQEKNLWKRLSEVLCNLRCKATCIDALSIDHPAKWKCLFDNPFVLVLAPLKTILRIPTLAAAYTFSPHTQEHHLFGIQFFPLKLGHLYLQQPDLKKELWTHLCRMLALPKSP